MAPVQVLLSERMLRAHPALTPMHANLYSNGFGFFGVLSLLHATGELAEAPTSIPWALLALSATLSNSNEMHMCKAYYRQLVGIPEAPPPVKARRPQRIGLPRLASSPAPHEPASSPTPLSK